MPTELALGLIFAASAFTMSFAGFGLALIAVPLLSLILPIKMAVPVQFPYLWGLFIFQAWHYRQYVDWRETKPLIVGSLVGITGGTLLLYHLSEAILIRALSIFIAGTVLFNLTPAGKKTIARYANNPWWGRICGFLSGAFLGAYTIGGPPIVLYIMSITDNPQKTKGTLGTFFSFQLIYVAVAYYVLGVFTWEGIKITGQYTPLVLLSCLAGFWAFGKASSQVYRRVVDILLLATSFMLWFRA
jgi:uncharacterized membrane protein YfcA